MLLESPDDRARRTVTPTLVMLLSVLIASLTAVTMGVNTAAAAPGEPSRFVPVEPCRLLDTRLGAGAVAADGTIDVAVVSDACGVPGDADAAALTITVDEPAGPGFVTAFPTGTARPEASVLNYRSGETLANSQLLQIGSGGRVSLYTMATTDLIVDVTGYFVPAGGEVSAGRFVPVATHRLIDTRTATRPAPGSAVRVTPDVPAGAIAVAVNITTTESTGAGFFTAYAAGSPLPLASVLNTDRAGQTRAAAAIVPVSDAGFDVHTMRGDHVIVDITGYFTGTSSAASSAGLFVAAVPARLVDTRLPAGTGGGPRLWDHGAREFAVTAITGGQVAAVSANVTMTHTEDPGFVTALPARAARPVTSSVNADAAQRTVANGAIIETSTAGVQFSTREATHLVVDISGWFTGSPVAADGPPPVNVAPPDRKATIITDSAMAGVRWSGGLGGLQGFVVDHRMESCRRLVQPSCRGREGYRPRTVVGEIEVLAPAGPEDMLVIATGYDDWYLRFSSDFDVVMAAARAKGFHHVAWVTFRSNVPYGSGGFYAVMNNVMREKVASGLFPEVRIWDYESYTAQVDGWFTSDGIHLTSLGAWGSADWLSRHVRAFDDRPCAQPMRPGAAPLDPCPDPDTLPQTIGYPDIPALYTSS
jgi:hypothetical protein